jgi:hypothetical protein
MVEDTTKKLQHQFFEEMLDRFLDSDEFETIENPKEVDHETTPIAVPAYKILAGCPGQRGQRTDRSTHWSLVSARNVPRRSMKKILRGCPIMMRTLDPDEVMATLDRLTALLNGETTAQEAGNPRDPGSHSAPSGGDLPEGPDPGDSEEEGESEEGHAEARRAAARAGQEHASLLADYGTRTFLDPMGRLTTPFICGCGGFGTDGITIPRGASGEVPENTFYWEPHGENARRKRGTGQWRHVCSRSTHRNVRLTGVSAIQGVHDAVTDMLWVSNTSEIDYTDWVEFYAAHRDREEQPPAEPVIEDTGEHGAPPLHDGEPVTMAQRRYQNHLLKFLCENEDAALAVFLDSDETRQEKSDKIDAVNSVRHLLTKKEMRRRQNIVERDFEDASNDFVDARIDLEKARNAKGAAILTKLWEHMITPREEPPRDVPCFSEIERNDICHDCGSAAWPEQLRRCDNCARLVHKCSEDCAFDKHQATHKCARCSKQYKTTPDGTAMTDQDNWKDERQGAIWDNPKDKLTHWAIQLSIEISRPEYRETRPCEDIEEEETRPPARSFRNDAAHSMPPPQSAYVSTLKVSVGRQQRDPRAAADLERRAREVQENTFYDSRLLVPPEAPAHLLSYGDRQKWYEDYRREVSRRIGYAVAARTTSRQGPDATGGVAPNRLSRTRRRN